MAKEKETKTIDWNIWHNIIKDSVRAFDVETTAAVCKKLGITYFSDDELVYASDLRNWIEDICEKLIEWEVNDKGVVEDHVNAYKEDDTGIKVAELHLHNNNVDDELMVDPNIVIKLRGLSKTGSKIPQEIYFEIYFEIVGQFW